MSTLKVGSLFTGYGGLDLAIGGDLAWYSEIEPAAIQILEHHFPGVPNLGDITKINWDEVEPVDIITGGYPCQPFSHAGSRKGSGDVRHLWPYVREAIRTIRPDFAVLENVRGHVTLGLKEVLGEIADIGFDAEWGTFRASAVGVPHRRERIFIVATDTDSAGRRERGWTIPVQEEHAAVERGSDVASDADGSSGETRINTGRNGERLREEPLGSTLNTWGDYTEAITRWETVLGRAAPEPTVVDEKTLKLRLNPVFVEWMMGLPTGWVTGHGLSRAKELKMLGNGVVPQQARVAVGLLACRV
jgi:DNA (cytosine-5)-methyltransferase 1